MSPPVPAAPQGQRYNIARAARAPGKNRDRAKGIFGKECEPDTASSAATAPPSPHTPAHEKTTQPSAGLLARGSAHRAVGLPGCPVTLSTACSPLTVAEAAPDLAVSPHRIPFSSGHTPARTPTHQGVRQAPPPVKACYTILYACGRRKGGGNPGDGVPPQGCRTCCSWQAGSLVTFNRGERAGRISALRFQVTHSNRRRERSSDPSLGTPPPRAGSRRNGGHGPPRPGVGRKRPREKLFHAAS